MNEQIASYRRKTAVICDSRWLAYAAAGAATTLGGTPVAEATIIYSGPINQSFNASSGNFDVMRFQIGNTASLIFLHRRFPNPNSGSGKAEGGIVGFSGAGIAGFQASADGFIHNYASKLTFDQNVSIRPLLPAWARAGDLTALVMELSHPATVSRIRNGQTLALVS